MKKISSESAAVPTVSINFEYFIETKFMLTGEIYTDKFIFLRLYTPGSFSPVSSSISMIFTAAADTGVPGPKIAITPAL